MIFRSYVQLPKGKWSPKLTVNEIDTSANLDDILVWRSPVKLSHGKRMEIPEKKNMGI